MRGAAWSLAQTYIEEAVNADAILASDLLDIAAFQALTRKQTWQTPFIVYFHENQLAYPTAPGKKRPTQLALTNISSALCADRVVFNSEFHRESFLAALPTFLKAFPDEHELWTVDTIVKKSTVYPVGLALEHVSTHKASRSGPLRILWNHRWSYDKQPQVFAKTLLQLAENGHQFRIIVTGEKEINPPPAFVKLRNELTDFIEHFGYVASREDYFRLLQQADVVVSTAIQEFFGISVCEAIYSGCYPLLPRRLNYPSLIPKEHHDTHLYHKPHELLNRLATLCQSPQLARQYKYREALRSHIAQYDWVIVAPQYAALIEDVIRA